MRTLGHYLDDYGDFLRADFRQFYNLDIDDVWTGGLDFGYALILAEQLKLNPQSRTRALWLGSIEFMGWGPEQHALANLHDLIASGFYGLGRKQMPNSARYPRPQPEAKQALTLAQFADVFVRQLSG